MLVAVLTPLVTSCEGAVRVLFTPTTNSVMVDDRRTFSDSVDKVFNAYCEVVSDLRCSGVKTDRDSGLITATYSTVGKGLVSIRISVIQASGNTCVVGKFRGLKSDTNSAVTVINSKVKEKLSES